MITKAEGYYYNDIIYTTREAAVKAARRDILRDYLLQRDRCLTVPSAYSAIDTFLDHYDDIMKELQAIN